MDNREDATPAGSPSDISRSLPLLPMTLVSDDNNSIPQDLSSMNGTRSPRRTRGGKEYIALPAEEANQTVFDADEVEISPHGINSHLRAKYLADEHARGDGSSSWSPVSPFSAKAGV